MKFIEFNDVIFETTRLTINKLRVDIKFNILVQNGISYTEKTFNTKEDRDNAYEEIKRLLDVTVL